MSRQIAFYTVPCNFQENYRMGGSYKWPTLADVLEYRRQVKEVVIDVIENAPLEFPITPQSPWVGY